MKQRYLLYGLITVISLIFVFVFYPLFIDETKNQKAVTSKIEQKVYNLRFGHNIPVTSTLHKASDIFAKRVEQKTDGRVKIEIFPAQKLGNDHKMVEMARRGDLDIILTPTAKLSLAMPSLQFVDLPFYFPEKNDLYHLLDGDVGKMLLHDLKDIDLIGVTFWENGFKHFTSNFPLTKLEDFEGKNFRIMKSRILVEQFKALEANPIPIDFHATKKALEDGVVDGQENPLIAIYSMDFYKVQSNLTVSNHGYLGYVFSISSKVFEKLPNDIQNILIETAKEITPDEREETAKKEKFLLEQIEKSGVKIDELSLSEKEKIAKKLLNISKQYEEVIGSDIISKAEEYLTLKYFMDNDEYVFIGLDADISMGAKISGLSIKRGIELAIEDINNNGGILGKKLRLITKDHSAISSKSIENIKEFSKNEKIVGVIGGLHSAVILEGMEEIKKANFPFIVPWGAAPILTKDTDTNIFRVSANDKFASKFILQSAMKISQNPAIFVENSIWGRSSLEIMKKELLNHKKEFVKIVVYNRGQKDFHDDIGSAIKNGADSIIMVANPNEGGKILDTVASYEKPLPIVSHWGILGGDFYKKHKENIEKVDLRFIQTFSFINSNEENIKDLGLNYLKKYGLKSVYDIKAPAGVAQAYDATKLLALAIKKANSFDYDKVQNALENIEYSKGILKEYKRPFSAKDHDALDINDFFMSEFDENGFIVKKEE